MNHDQNLVSINFSIKLQAIAKATKEAVADSQGNIAALLALLRQLEHLHREIRDGVFQENLPDNRQRLYALLRDIESEGGWPYIERMRLQGVLKNMPDQIILDNKVAQQTSDTLESDNSLEW
jgi:hypothetical protein